MNESVPSAEQCNVPGNSETLARWIWFHYVGIPVTEPYDKEYTRLFDRIEALQRGWFTRGLTEARKQFSSSVSAAVAQERERLEAVIERDRTAIADGVSGLKRAIAAREWLCEGRGSCEWDDDRWHEEFQATRTEILEALKPLVRIAADLTNSPKTQELADKARGDLQRKDALTALEAYMQLGDELDSTEDSDEDCSCDPNNFHTCEFCKGRDELDTERRRLLELHGENWAIMLSLATSKLGEFGQQWDGKRYVFSGKDT